MADGDVRPDDQRHARIDVQHRTVLDVAALADGDRVVVGADHRTRPHARVLAEPHASDDRGAFGDIGRRRNVGDVTVELVDRHARPFADCHDPVPIHPSRSCNNRRRGLDDPSGLSAGACASRRHAHLHRRSVRRWRRVDAALRDRRDRRHRRRQASSTRARRARFAAPAARDIASSSCRAHAARSRLRRLPRALVQLPVIASYGTQLLDWLERHTFPAEQAMRRAGGRACAARLFFDSTLACGTTTVASFCTSHPASVDAFFQEAHSRGVRAIAGKTLMDRHAPRRAARHGQAWLRRIEGADRALARARAARVRDHAALRADVLACAARGCRRVVARASRLLAAIARRGEPARDRMGARAVPGGARLRRRVRALRAARPPRDLRSRHPPARARAGRACGDLDRARPLPDVEPLSGQRPVLVATRQEAATAVARRPWHATSVAARRCRCSPPLPKRTRWRRCRA